MPTGLWVQPACFSPGAGRKATLILDGSGAGFTWDGFSDAGKRVGSGIYLAAANVDGDAGPVYTSEVCVVDAAAAGDLNGAWLAPNPLLAGNSQAVLRWGRGPVPQGLLFEARVFDLSGSLVAAMVPSAPGVLVWVPAAGTASGIYLVECLGRLKDGRSERRRFKLAVFR